ncbi:hypothetical protein [Pseudomonas sp. MN1F]|nr:hypothetical protein [Pseudomonas sp. MN1F]
MSVARKLGDVWLIKEAATPQAASTNLLAEAPMQRWESTIAVAA